MLFSSTSPSYPSQVLIVFPIDGDTPKHSPQVKPQALISHHLSKFLLPATKVRLTKEYLAKLATSSQPHRPAERTTQLNSDYPYAILQPDMALCFGPSTVLVEMKTKNALLSRSKLIPPHEAKVLRKYTSPNYHIKNYLIPNGCIPDEPYDPADILSLDLPRVTAAINTMRRERSRALRVFRDGTIVDPGDNTDALTAAAHALVSTPECCKAILDLQAYDVLDSAGAETVLSRLHMLVGESRAHSLIREHLYYDSPIQPAGDKLCYESAREASLTHSMSSFEEAVNVTNEFNADQCASLLARFLQAATAKDCSLLIALCPASESLVSGKHRVVTEAGDWVFRLCVVDVGEKGVERIFDRWGPEDRRRVQILEEHESSASN